MCERCPCAATAFLLHFHECHYLFVVYSYPKKIEEEKGGSVGFGDTWTCKIAHAPLSWFPPRLPPPSLFYHSSSSSFSSGNEHNNKGKNKIKHDLEHNQQTTFPLSLPPFLRQWPITYFSAIILPNPSFNILSNPFFSFILLYYYFFMVQFSVLVDISIFFTNKQTAPSRWRSFLLPLSLFSVGWEVNGFNFCFFVLAVVWLRPKREYNRKRME